MVNSVNDTEIAKQGRLEVAEYGTMEAYHVDFMVRRSFLQLKLYDVRTVPAAISIRFGGAGKLRQPMGWNCAFLSFPRRSSDGSLMGDACRQVWEAKNGHPSRTQLSYYLCADRFCANAMAARWRENAAWLCGWICSSIDVDRSISCTEGEAWLEPWHDASGYDDWRYSRTIIRRAVG